MSSTSAWSGVRPHIDASELLCKTGCGFYGNPAWEGHCSKCYKELLNKQQRKPVFDPSQIKNKVTQSVSDVSELQSKATSLMSKKFDKFEEKRKQQLDKKTKAVKSIFKKSHANKGLQKSKDPTRLPRQLSEESKAAVHEFHEFFKTVNKDAEQVLRKHINFYIEKCLQMMESLSVDDLSDMVHDFYNSFNDLMKMSPVFQDFTNEQIDKVGELTERFITTRIYKTLISEVNALAEDRDLEIQRRIRSLNWVSATHLECRVDESNPEVRTIMDQVISDLIEMDSRRVPLAKLRLLVSASHAVLSLLRIPPSDGGAAAAPASADDFLPALILCVIRANPPLLHSNITYITNFAQQTYLQSGEDGYFFTNLCCAVSFIEKLTAESLGLTSHEFDRFMAGDALPPNALSEDYASESLLSMRRSLSTLCELESRLCATLDSYDVMVNDMQKLKDNIMKEVDTVLLETPLDIRPPARANIDDADQDSLNMLPPPLTPQSFGCDKPNTSDSNWPPVASSAPPMSLPFLDSNPEPSSFDPFCSDPDLGSIACATGACSLPHQGSISPPSSLPPPLIPLSSEDEKTSRKDRTTVEKK